MASYLEYYNTHQGAAPDLDKAFGCQCWDGAMDYLKYLYGAVIHCTWHGYACDIWEQKATNGILNYCVEVTELKQGDIVVFKRGGNYCSLSHIAMFHGDAGNGFGWFFGTNQGGVSGFTLQKLPYSETFETAFRPKCFTTSVPKDVKPSPNNTSNKWLDTVVKVGDTVKSVSCAITGVIGDCVIVPALGGNIPMKHVSEASDTKDGKCDGYLATIKAKVYLDPCKVQAIDVKNNRVKVHGYWIDAKPLLVKK